MKVSVCHSQSHYIIRALRYHLKLKVISFQSIQRALVASAYVDVATLHPILEIF